MPVPRMVVPMRLGIGGWRRSVTRRLCWLAMSAVAASCASVDRPPAPVHPPAAVPSGPVHGGTGPCRLISLNAIGPRQANSPEHAVAIADFANFAHARATRTPDIEAAMTGPSLRPAVGAVGCEDEHRRFTPGSSSCFGSPPTSAGSGSPQGSRPGTSAQPAALRTATP